MWRAVLLMSLAIVSTARAGGFRDPESGLSITLGGSDAKVCYIRPKALRDAACAGKHVDDVDGQSADNQHLLALVESPDASYAVVATWLTTLVEGPIMPGRDTDEVFRDASEALRGEGFTPSDKFPQLVTVHGLQLLTFAMTSPTAGVLVEYVVRSGGHLIVIQFGGDVPLPKARELAATAIATLSLPPPETRLPPGTPAVAIAIVLATTSCALLAFIAWRLRRSRVDDDDVELWAHQQRRSAGLRIAAVGHLIWVPAILWLVVYANWDTNVPVTRIKLVGGTVVAIGLTLAIAGFVMIGRARRRPLPAAIARKPQR